MGREITEFVVIAPDSMGKTVAYARDRIIERLSRSFPGYTFHVESYGPVASEDEFTILPVVGVVGDGVKRSDPEKALNAERPPRWLLAAIKDVLREFELGG